MKALVTGSRSCRVSLAAAIASVALGGCDPVDLGDFSFCLDQCPPDASGGWPSGPSSPTPQPTPGSLPSPPLPPSSAPQPPPAPRAQPDPAELYDEATGRWSDAGPLSMARLGLSATLLPSGKVLVAGGWDGTQHRTAELYDPATASFGATGSMATARSGHTATLLASGKVLVAGGWPLASAELYDPSSGNWTVVASMAGARHRHTATLLPSGKVLVIGGWSDTGWPGAELYDPSFDRWTPASGSSTLARGGHTATLLPSGKVLVAGGYGVSLVEMYDPDTGSWSVTGSLRWPRGGHTATLLASGKVLVVGGERENSAGTEQATAELYDPDTGTWTEVGSLASPRCLHTATLLPSGEVLVAGGYDGTGHRASSASVASAEVYDPISATWRATGSLRAARSFATATLLHSGQVLVAGGL